MKKSSSFSSVAVLAMGLLFAVSCTSPPTESPNVSAKKAEYEKTHEKFASSISKEDFTRVRLIWDGVKSNKKISDDDFAYIVKLCTEPYSPTDNIGFVRTHAGATFTIPADFTEDQVKEIQTVSLAMLQEESEQSVRAGLAILRDRKDPIGKELAVPLTQDKRERVAEGAKLYLEAIGVKAVE
jgi:hypothetical protein